MAATAKVFYLKLFSTAVWAHPHCRKILLEGALRDHLKLLNRNELCLGLRPTPRTVLLAFNTDRSFFRLHDSLLGNIDKVNTFYRIWAFIKCCCGPNMLLMQQLNKTYQWRKQPLDSVKIVSVSWGFNVVNMDMFNPIAMKWNSLCIICLKQSMIILMLFCRILASKLNMRTVVQVVFSLITEFVTKEVKQFIISTQGFFCYFPAKIHK